MTTLAARIDNLDSIRQRYGEAVEKSIKAIVGDKEVTDYWMDRVLGNPCIYFRYDGKLDFVRLSAETF